MMSWPLSGVPKDKDYYILGLRLGPPIYGNYAAQGFCSFFYPTYMGVILG